MKKRKSYFVGLFFLFCLMQLSIISMAGNGVVKLGNKHYYYNGNAVFVRKTSGSGKHCFNMYDEISEMYACDGYLIIYIYDQGTYRVSTDGKSIKKLTSGECFGVSGKYIYYTINNDNRYNPTYYIKRMKVNGGGKKTIKKSKEWLYGYWVEGKYMYYLAEKLSPDSAGAFSLFRCTLNGKNVKYIMPQANDSLHPQFVKGSYGYYSEFRVTQDGYSWDLKKRNYVTGKTKRVKKNILEAETDGKYIYYAKFSTGGRSNIYKRSIKTGKTTCIVKMKDVRGITIVGSQLYFRTGIGSGAYKLYTCSKNGKNLRFLEYVFY